MVFSSTVFLFIFLPAVFILHTIIPEKWINVRNTLLAAASLVFYAYGEPLYILLMVGSVYVNYAFTELIRINDYGSERKKWTSGLVTANVIVLGCFKYLPAIFGFASQLVGGVRIPLADITIPVGISFYTFQIISYVVDTLADKNPPARSFSELLLYISFFPQLIAGPIVKYNDICLQIRSRSVTIDKIAIGIRRFTLGLSKKVLVSNNAAILAKAAFESSSPSSALCAAGAIAYSLQLYFDFSGYSDMAIGLAHMFGFDLLENFNYPYAAVTIRDFWKRWHISLTSWFREYVYFPLGGNRISKSRTIINRLIVFFLTGLWHGANLTFVVWGMWHGLLMLLEQVAHFDKLAEKPLLRPLLRLYTLTTVVLGFVVFNSPNIPFAFSYIGRIFSLAGNPSDLTALLSPFMIMWLVVAIVFSLPVLPEFRKLERFRVFEALSYIAVIPLLVLNIMSLASGGFNPFIYYTF